MKAFLLNTVEASRHYTASLLAFFSIPPLSESMAGVIILFVFMNSMATSIWMSNAWAPFVYLLFNNSNLAVGVVSGVNGFFEVSCAIISGHIADKFWGPSRTLIFAVQLGMVKLCFVIIAIWVKHSWLLIVAQAFEGCYMGLSLTCVESVFAQCLHTGERDRLYSLKFSVESVGPIVGLIASLILYLIVGTEWNVQVLQIVMTCGVALDLISMIIFSKLFVALPSHLDHKMKAAAATEVVLMDDVHSEGGGVPSFPARTYDVEEHRVMDAAGHNKEVEELSLSYLVQSDKTGAADRPGISAVHRTMDNCSPPVMSRYRPSVCTPRVTDAASLRSSQNTTTARMEADKKASSVNESPTSVAVGLDGADISASMISLPQGRPNSLVDIHNIPPGSHIEYVDHEYEEASACRRRVMDWLPLRTYPMAIVFCDVVVVLGSGMITRYLPLFLMKSYNASLATICVLNLFNSFVIALMAIVNGFVGKKYGRIRAAVLPKIVGTLLLLYMALAQKTPYGSNFWMFLAYVLRNAFMNCTVGLSRALIMDLVPEHRHSRWNALESAQSAGWSGSAIVGGLMADKLGYGAAFIFTFFFHLFSTSALLPFAVRNDARLPQPVLVHDCPPEALERGKEHTAITSPTEALMLTPMTATTKAVRKEVANENVHIIASGNSMNREVEQNV
ncbi:hypothetical protein, conserved [Leishmania tarentolae]|uniref:Major facilitator superfamily (MFS) profile domain-containing protein n=1 Tax=Leishmania tarentolae TaxID=5689 RepID=A0A640KXP9_LEITA|nr:hypothetical protein, conserved [Leishmania tarentolae]